MLLLLLLRRLRLPDDDELGSARLAIHVVCGNWCMSWLVMVTHRERERRHRCPPRYAVALHKSPFPVHIMQLRRTDRTYTLATAVCSSNNIKPQFNAQFIIAGIFRATATAAADHCSDYLWHRTRCTGSVQFRDKPNTSQPAGGSRHRRSDDGRPPPPSPTLEK